MHFYFINLDSFFETCFDTNFDVSKKYKNENKSKYR